MTEPELSPEELQRSMRDFYDKVIAAFIVTYATLDDVADHMSSEDERYEGVSTLLDRYKPFFEALTKE